MRPSAKLKSEFGLSIRARITLFQFTVTLAMITLAVTASLFFATTHYSRERVRLANQQSEAMVHIAASANRYSEQIAEILLLGEAERPELESARSQVVEAFYRLQRLIDIEAALIRDEDERKEELGELRQLDRMRALFADVDRTVERLLALGQAGRRLDAVAVLRYEIENNFDSALQKLIIEGVAGERAELERVQADAERLSFWFGLAVITISVALIVLTIFAGRSFTRSLVRPIGALTQGAEAITRGDLDHRIDYDRRDELGLLARSFNLMANELGQQRKQLFDAQADLEGQVRRRTWELGVTNERLILVDRQRVRFLADASHELRTPLTVLRGEAEVALRGQGQSQRSYRQALERIVDQAVDMGRLVDDLLFLARSESEEMRFEYCTAGLRDVVSEAVREAANLASEGQIRITAQGPETPSVVRADPGRLKQAVMIVLDNAIKYSAPGRPIQVSLQTTSDRVAELTVSDQGSGIAQDELPYVFERFYRGARACASSGSGLGLSIAKWIVEKHGGTIAVSSTGDGTDVVIRIPALG